MEITHRCQVMGGPGSLVVRIVVDTRGRKSDVRSNDGLDDKNTSSGVDALTSAHSLIDFQARAHQMRSTPRPGVGPEVVVGGSWALGRQSLCYRDNGHSRLGACISEATV